MIRSIPTNPWPRRLLPAILAGAFVIPGCGTSVSVDIDVDGGDGGETLQIISFNDSQITFGDLTGDLFFLLRDNDGRRLYTQRGGMLINADQKVTTLGGHFVQGFAVDEDFNVLPFDTADISIPIGNLTLQEATTDVVFAGVLSAGDTAIGETIVVPLLVYTPQGTPVGLEVRFTFSAASESATVWSLTIAFAGGGIDIFSELLIFEAPGNLQGPGHFDVTADLGDGQQTIHYEFRPINGDRKLITTVEIASQNGFSAVTLTSYDLRTNGQIVGNFEGMLERVIGRFAVARIANPETLVDEDNGVFSTGANTANPVFVTTP